ncbi:hypothetical protein T492DRAFT_874244, partial [Pavlovales sp. CCMP2436]
MTSSRAHFRAGRDASSRFSFTDKLMPAEALGMYGERSPTETRRALGMYGNSSPAEALGTYGKGSSTEARHVRRGIADRDSARTALSPAEVLGMYGDSSPAEALGMYGD